MQNSTELHFANAQTIPAIQRLLKSSGLPYTDIEKHINNFVFIDDGNRLIGCVGLEIYDDIGLLRSLAVDKSDRSKGLGKFLVKEILQYANATHVKKVFLLTTTAQGFFDKFGFIEINRSEAPEAIQKTAEFSSMCPTTAVLMYTNL